MAAFMDTLTKMLGSLGAASASLSADMTSKLIAPMQALTPMLGSIAGAFEKLMNLGGLSSVISVIAHLVEGIDPALMMQFQLVMRDLGAVIGEILQPVLVVVVQLIRKFADMLTTMKPAFDPLISVIIDMVGVVSDLLLPVFKIVTPLIQIYGNLMKMLVPIFKMLGDAITTMANVVMKAIGYIIEAYNKLAKSRIGRNIGMKEIQGFDQMEKKSSFGKAVGHTGSMSGEDLGKQARQAVMSIGHVSPEVKATNDLKASVDGWGAKILNMMGMDLGGKEEGSGEGGSWASRLNARTLEGTWASRRMGPEGESVASTPTEKKPTPKQMASRKESETRDAERKKEEMEQEMYNRIAAKLRSENPVMGNLDVADKADAIQKLSSTIDNLCNIMESNRLR